MNDLVIEQYLIQGPLIIGWFYVLTGNHFQFVISLRNITLNSQTVAKLIYTLHIIYAWKQRYYENNQAIFIGEIMLLFHVFFMLNLSFRIESTMSIRVFIITPRVKTLIKLFDFKICLCKAWYLINIGQ